MRGKRLIVIGLPAVLSLTGVSTAEELPLCPSRPQVTPELTCLIDGDSGWQRGTRWHLLGVDAPEIDVPNADCRREQLLGMKAMEKLRSMMSRGYTILYRGKKDDAGRQLVQLELADGRDAASELMSMGLVQALPNNGEKWCLP